MNRAQRHHDALYAALGSIGDAVITMDTEGRITFLNSVAESLTGSPRAEAVGQPIGSVFRIVNKTNGRPAASLPARAIRNGVRVNRHVLIAKDGTEQLIDDSAVPTHDKYGEVAEVVLVFRAIAKPQKRKLATQAALAYAADIIATLPDPFVVLDSDLRVKTANRSFYESFHVSRKETENQLLYDLIDGQWNIPGLRKMLDEVVRQSRSVHDVEVEQTFSGLGRKTMTLNACCFPPDAKHAEYVLLAIQDITERRRAEMALRASEVRYRRLFETAQDAILILQGDTGKIIDSNPFLCHLLGYYPNELLGKELWQIGLFEDIEGNRAAFRQLREKGYIRYEDLPLQTKDGRHVYVEFVSNAYPVEGDQVIQCNIRDISARRRAEEALRQADLRKDEFLAVLAHELRNPLAPLRTAVQFLRRKGSDDADVHWFRDVLERQVQHLTRLVDDLLDVSRFNRGKIHLQIEPVDVAAVVAHAVEISRPLIDAHGHSLEISHSKAAIHVLGDPIRLAQVLANLLNNAAKYTDDGGHIRVTVEATAIAAVLRVRDTGIGIAADMLPQLFHMFTRAPGSDIRSRDGLGVGLTLARKLVEMHGGRIEAHSDGLGLGSEFQVYLPLVPSSTTPLHEEKSAFNVSARQVLIVDDNQDAAEGLAKLLRLDGHEVQTAHGGAAALELAGAQPPDVVLLDVCMPGMDGLEVARRMRQDLGLTQALLVALTGYGQAEDRRRSIEAGFDMHLVKPVDMHALESLLARPVFRGLGCLEPCKTNS